jgi:hypothetical protein
MGLNCVSFQNRFEEKSRFTQRLRSANIQCGISSHILIVKIMCNVSDRLRYYVNFVFRWHSDVSERF